MSFVYVHDTLYIHFYTMLWVSNLSKLNYVVYLNRKGWTSHTGQRCVNSYYYPRVPNISVPLRTPELCNW
ncbi:hypothetical protein ERO13_A09G113468v2 [Gossypium hirsutum]|nr:hypothetical protein ERO13_D03G138250v2 [Gossypium hirsutum]KAG4183516.1 hypothetical protein ERO13_A09G113468v2 [Gossypium hirsutum]